MLLRCYELPWAGLKGFLFSSGGPGAKNGEYQAKNGEYISAGRRYKFAKSMEPTWQARLLSSLKS